MKPFIVDEVFEVNREHDKPQFFGNYLVVDNFYKNFDQILEILNTMPYEGWKKKEGSRNFIDYYDCRPILKNWPSSSTSTENSKFLNDIIRHWILKYFGREIRLSQTPMGMKEFNVFKHINLPKEGYQLAPHTDGGWTILVYIDEVADGGTALYKKNKNFQSFDEGIQLLQDVSELELIEVMPAKPNRLVIFPGHMITHGAYIEDHTKYLNNWRINQIMFIPEVKENS